MKIEAFAALFAQPSRVANGYSALCPVHEDTRASLSISEKGSRILVHCHAGCPTEEIVRKVGRRMADLYNGCQNGDVYSSSRQFTPSGSYTAGNKQIRASRATSKIVEVYDYTDPAGLILYQNVRHEPKEFRHRRPDGKGGYIPNLDGIERVPYRLPELLEAMRTI